MIFRPDNMYCAFFFLFQKPKSSVSIMLACMLLCITCALRMLRAATAHDLLLLSAFLSILQTLPRGELVQHHPSPLMVVT